MKNISIIKYLEHDVWEKRLEQSEHKIKLESGSERLESFALIETPHILIGVNYEDNSVYPKVKKLENEDHYLVGIDSRLILVNSEDEKVKSKVDLQSLFVDVVEIEDKGLVIIEEIGVGLYSYTGERLWFAPTDFVETYYIEDDMIVVKTDCGKVKLSTLTGKKV